MMLPMARLLRLLVGLVLLPLCWATVAAVLDLSPSAMTKQPPWIATSLLAMVAGYVCWLLIFTFLPTPVRAYIWGHELTHAVWGLLTGARVGPIKVGNAGGSVRLSHAGLFTTLAPYFVPFYTVLLLLLRLLLGMFVEMGQWDLLWLFLVGLTWGFHLSFTLRSLAQRQPDIQAFGRIFSYVLIFLFNTVALGYCLVGITAATLPEFHQRLAQRAARAYRGTARTAVSACARGGAAMRRISRASDRTHLLDELQ
jgi:hypothetical protein